jgi:hypothetical protein
MASSHFIWVHDRVIIIVQQQRITGKLKKTFKIGMKMTAFYCNMSPTLRGQFKKVPYFIPAERIPVLSWQAWVQLIHIITTRQQ